MSRSSIRSRRRGQRVVGFAVAVAFMAALFIGVVAAGCGGEEGDGGGTEPTATAGAIKRGGVLRIGMQAGNGQWDPVLMAGAIGDDALQAQVLENLCDLAPDFSVSPALAASWETEDAKVWRFTLQEGVTFTNGEPFTSEDVVYSFERLRSKELGSPMADIYANIEDVVAEDPTHVTFKLKAPDSEFPASLTDYRAKMLCKSVADPMKELVGTGPFMLESFAAEDRAVLKRNPDYWGKDEDGNQLPYLDGIEFVYSPDIAGQIEGLQGGSLDFVGGLTAEQKQAVEGNSNLKVLETDTNYCFELQIRCDEGPGKELAFRQALMAGTDRQAIVDLVAPGVGVPGNGTIVGPAYSAYYLDEQVSYDPERAKQLLADAGFADGAKIKLVAQTQDPVPAIATAWQAQMKKIGVDVAIQQVPTDVYYAEEGEDNWYKAQFSFVDWGTRASPITYFKLALTSDAPWNYSRWKNEEFDTLVDRIPSAVDEDERAELYKEAQRILQDQVPMINFIINKAVAGLAGNLEGVTLHPDYVLTQFKTAHFAE